MPTLRPTRDSDVAELGELLDDVFRRSKGVTDQSQLTDFPLVFAASNHRNSRVIVENGRIVSHAALWPRDLIVGNERLKAAVVVSVATDPQFRLRGHAAALMRDLQQTLQMEGYDLAILWTAVPDFYQKLGWQVVSPGGALVTVDAAYASRLRDVAYDFSRFNPERHLDAVRALHDRERVRFVRSCDQALQLLTLPKIHVWVASRDQQVVAYLVNAEAINKRGLIEYGGETDGIRALVGHVLQSCSLPTAEIRWMLFPSHPDLIDWSASIRLPSQRLESSKGSAYEMVLRVRPERISVQVLDQLFVWGLDWA